MNIYVRRLLSAGVAAMLPLTVVCAQEQESALRFEGGYTFDAISNVRGGVATGVRFLDNLDVALTADMGVLLGWEGATVYLNGLGNQGKSPSELIGDMQGVSNIDAPATWRLYEAWFNQELFGDRASVRVGLYDLNSEFDVMETAGLFLNSSHGIGPDFAQTGLNGPSIFPVTSLGFRARATPVPWLSVQGVILDGVPGDPRTPGRTAVRLRSEDGALFAGEVALRGADLRSPRDFRIAVGGYFYTRHSECLLPSEDEGGRRSAKGVYGLVEGRLYREAGSMDQGARAFFRTGTSDEVVHQLSSYIGVGLVYTGPLDGRGQDQLGMAVATAFNGRRFREMRRQEGTVVDGSEVALELTYLAILPFGLSLQPDLQFIINPGTERSRSNALVLGIRTGMAF